MAHVCLKLRDNTRLMCTKGASRDFSLNTTTRIEFRHQEVSVTSKWVVFSLPGGLPESGKPSEALCSLQ